ncbi:Hypothetical_protein [Hexamita inflata]|uniref:Hypothetical_protein n=1 Tax=Hexamita inflata TaxID=28002 RepID=A0AA86PE93_9EUKA|nr:Hypothetical protein HINF_LOCUS23393 [Hexamita inflata]
MIWIFGSVDNKQKQNRLSHRSNIYHDFKLILMKTGKMKHITKEQLLLLQPVFLLLLLTVTFTCTLAQTFINFLFLLFFFKFFFFKIFVVHDRNVLTDLIVVPELFWDPVLQEFLL